MDETAKYIIHADVTADGVVERSDVVGAVFGQTEGLLGDELDIRDLQDSSRLGRIDVDVESESGRSFGHVTIASNLDRVETAILAAALETIGRVGPCEARFQVTDIQDARAAKRQVVVERAKELLATAFDGTFTSEELVAEVRESVAVEDVVEYEGFAAGPRVTEGDAVIVVEGRADVTTLLQYGIKNAIAVEGTGIPDAVADLTVDRTVTAFLDGDRGGDLVLRELAQVGSVDHVARAPEGESVEDLSREAVLSALRQKVPLDVALDRLDAPATADEADGRDDAPATATDEAASGDAAETVADESASDGGAAVAAERPTGESEAEPVPSSLAGHAEAVVGGDTGTVRLLDADWAVQAEGEADAVVETLTETETAPHAVVVDGVVTQRLLDVAAQRGVRRVVGRAHGDYTKQPATVRVHTAADL
jgi:DNA primase